jgi:hypothetical protein
MGLCELRLPESSSLKGEAEGGSFGCLEVLAECGDEVVWVSFDHVMIIYYTWTV